MITSLFPRFKPSHNRRNKSVQITSLFWLSNLYVAFKKIIFQRMIIQRYYTDIPQTSDIYVQFPLLFLKVYAPNCFRGTSLSANTSNKTKTKPKRNTKRKKKSSTPQRHKGHGVETFNFRLPSSDPWPTSFPPPREKCSSLFPRPPPILAILKAPLTSRVSLFIY